MTKKSMSIMDTSGNDAARVARQGPTYAAAAIRNGSRDLSEAVA
jgi:hypothetical protein